jgi:sulfur-oxidizing protein SoxZ
MADLIKIRARLSGEVTEIRALMSHPMETGRRKNELGEVVPAHFIQQVLVTLNGKAVLEAQWGTGISKNPYLTFRLRGAKLGDKVGLSWRDSKGVSNSVETEVVAA